MTEIGAAPLNPYLLWRLHYVSAPLPRHRALSARHAAVAVTLLPPLPPACPLGHHLLFALSLRDTPFVCAGEAVGSL